MLCVKLFYNIKQVWAGKSQIMVVDSFYYMVDMLLYARGREAAVSTRIACTQKNSELVSLLMNQSSIYRLEYK